MLAPPPMETVPGFTHTLYFCRVGLSWCTFCINQITEHVSIHICYVYSLCLFSKELIGVTGGSQESDPAQKQCTSEAPSVNGRAGMPD